eukprot:RCo036041
MVKVKVLSRSSRQYVPATPGEVTKLRRNLNPRYHPMERATEYTRAVAAAKLERVFAKPFLGAFSEHTDTVQCLGKHPHSVGTVLAADCAGAVRVWDVPRRKALQCIEGAHRHMVTGATYLPDGQAYLTCSRDLTVKLWKATNPEGLSSDELKPVAEYLGEHPFEGISAHQFNTEFATTGQFLQLWDVNRTRPVHSFNWGDDPISTAAYNRSETHLLACCMRDRAVCLFDSRAQRAVVKLYLRNITNAVVWNPMRPMELGLANEDTNLYLCDARSLSRPRKAYAGHTAAVLAVDYSPTGMELVTGSFDKTLRLWDTKSDQTWSRDTYYAKRMQRVWSVAWTNDNNFILSGSDDQNLRIWKAYSHKPLKKLVLREQRALQYNEKLKERFKVFPEVNRLLQRRHIPKEVRAALRTRRAMERAEMRHQENVVLRGGQVKKHVLRDAVLKVEQ